MQRIAMGWLVYRLTDSEFLLGLIGFISVAPALLFGPIAGVVADRCRLRRIIIITQFVAMLQAAALAALVWTSSIELWHLIALSTALGLVNVFDVPARQSFIVQMVGNRHEDLSNAIALNSFVFNGARLVGPSIAGIIVGTLGEGVCFVLNAVSYVAVIAALLAMQELPPRRTALSARILDNVREGFAYCFGSGPIRALLILVGLVNMVGMPYSVLMPVFARDVLRGGPDTMGYLMAAAGIGAIAGAMTLAWRPSVLGLERLVARAPLVLGLSLVVFAQSHTMALSMLALVGIGLSMMTQMASTNTLLQTVVDDDKRGRVMGFYAMGFMITAPIGSLLSGVVAERIGAPWTVTVCGLLAAVAALLLTGTLSGLRPLVARSVRAEEPAAAASSM